MQPLSAIYLNSLSAFNCKKMHKFARFSNPYFCLAVPELVGPVRPAQTAQKEVCLARGRGGGASARFGGRKGAAYLTKSRLPGAHFRGASDERAGKSPPEWRWLRLVGDMTLRCCGLADTARNGGAAGRYRTAGNGGAAWCYCATSSRAYGLKRITSSPSQSLTCFIASITGVSSLTANTLAAFSTSPNDPLPSGMAPISCGGTR